MSNFDPTNTGTLGKNKNPQSEKSPPYKGQVNVEGVEYWVSGWVKKNGQTGESFFSLSLTPKQKANEQGVQQAKQAVNQGGGFDDEIPFAPYLKWLQA